MKKTLFVFLAILALVPLVASAKAAQAEDFDLAALFSGQCTATVTCGNGTTSSGSVSCSTSSGNCVTGPDYVECDGRRTTCGGGSGGFCTARVRTATCFLSCFSFSGNCSQTSNSVTCDGRTLTCR
jgi:hypothetical protein